MPNLPIHGDSLGIYPKRVPPIGIDCFRSRSLPIMPTLSDNLSDLGTEVPLASVERELKNLFASDLAITRASLINFAIYSEQPEDLADNTAIIREVTREHACRALLIAVTCQDHAPSVRAWITAHCNLNSSGGKSICSEQITLLMEGRSEHFVPNMVLSRLDSDLPLVFWWQGPLTENFEPALYSRIDRLIIDSGAWADPLVQFDLLEKAYRSSVTRLNVMDLAWTRVLPLRLALAACYDDPLALADFPKVNEITISHNPSHSLEARMIAAWMAHQAGWKWLHVPTGGRAEFSLESREGIRITLRFLTTDSAIPISSIRLCSPGATTEASRGSDCPFIRSCITSDSQKTEHLTPANFNTPAELIIERLRRGCNNRLYFTLLQSVRELLRA